MIYSCTVKFYLAKDPDVSSINIVSVLYSEREESLSVSVMGAMVALGKHQTVTMFMFMSVCFQHE